MANRISFSILTDAPYTKAEENDLIDAFITFILEEDPDVDTDSVEFSITEADSQDGEAEKIRQAAIEMIQNGILTVKVSAADAEDEELFDTGEVSVALKG